MTDNEQNERYLASGLLALFLLWTVLIQRVDVRPIGVNGTRVGFAVLNLWFHRFTGVHTVLYTVTDWLGLVPIAVCMGFGGLGFCQLVKRKSLWQVDPDILLLGVYYFLVIFAYLFFEAVPINYRPVLIDGRMEASYPSSTTLLVLSVMPTLWFQTERRVKIGSFRHGTAIFSMLFSWFMVLGRLISGVHWATDIIGSVFLSSGLYCLYRCSVFWADRKVLQWNFMRNYRHCESRKE